jgi:hypothetical protein
MELKLKQGWGVIEQADAADPKPIDRLLNEVRSKSQAELRAEMLELAYRRFGARWLVASAPPEVGNA